MAYRPREERPVSDSVLCEHEGAVATITLNRPEARNALTVDVKTRLLAELRRCGSDEA
jgi:enoyl-CoA hydratase/carnithine racemase